MCLIERTRSKDMKFIFEIYDWGITGRITKKAINTCTRGLRFNREKKKRKKMK